MDGSSVPAEALFMRGAADASAASFMPAARAL